MTKRSARTWMLPFTKGWSAERTLVYLAAFAHERMTGKPAKMEELAEMSGLGMEIVQRNMHGWTSKGVLNEIRPDGFVAGHPLYMKD